MRLTYKAQDQYGKETGTIWYASRDGDSIFPKSVKEEQVLKKLSAYEDAEENGLLVRLPCKVGDTIYVIHDGKIWDGEVYHISYSDYYGKITATAWVKHGISAAFEHFGKTVFLSREEAEAALEGEREDGSGEAAANHAPGRI